MNNNQQLTRSNPQALSIGGITVIVPDDYEWSRATAAAMTLLNFAHPNQPMTRETLAAYDVILRNFHPDLAAAAAQETLARVKWFPKPQEIAESARNILTLITSRGMYATDKAGYERKESIKTWELDMLEDTRDFIQRAKTERELKAEIAAWSRRREVGG